MTKLTKTYNRFDIVVVPFPFIDIETSKNRPALIISSSENFSKDALVMAMITSALHTPWPLDVKIKDLDAAGLPVPSLIRMKLFTLDYRLVIRKAGTLSAKDQVSFSKNLKLLFG